MDIAFDLPQTGQKCSDRAFEWHGLRARLFAARAARRALEPAGSMIGPERDGGSFDRVSARVLAGYGQALARVNLNALGNCKPDGDMAVAVAGERTAGDRGKR